VELLTCKELPVGRLTVNVTAYGIRNGSRSCPVRIQQEDAIRVVVLRHPHGRAEEPATRSTSL